MKVKSKLVSAERTALALNEETWKSARSVKSKLISHLPRLGAKIVYIYGTNDWFLY